MSFVKKIREPRRDPRAVLANSRAPALRAIGRSIGPARAPRLAAARPAGAKPAGVTGPAKLHAEAGFVRSIGLGSDPDGPTQSVQMGSLAVRDDATRPSLPETWLNSDREIITAERARARGLIGLIVAGRISRYDGAPGQPPGLEPAAGRRVRSFARPFYAGWGLTEDAIEIPRRRRARSLEDVFHAFCLRFPRDVDPRTGRRREPEDLLDAIGAARAERGR